MTHVRQTLRSNVTLNSVIEDREQYRQLVVPVHREDLDALVINLVLLEHGLAQCLELVSEGERIIVRRGSRGRLTSSGKRWDIELSADQLEWVVAFLLVYCRDGAADVDHLDMELEDADDGAIADVTILVDRFKPPMSGEVARRLLADD